MLWAHSQSLKSVEASRPCFEVLMFLGFKWDSVRLRLVGWNLGEIKDGFVLVARYSDPSRDRRWSDQ